MAGFRGGFGGFGGGNQMQQLMKQAQKMQADMEKAQRELGWKAEKGIDEMCADSYRWQSQNPNGYED